ncbi:MAG TPA: lamin tail domain-containing protein, partial [Blastocatellia bacterium]|nr:lamin tail domain-containing protein [Blastocatellia bacterium]
MNHSMSPTNPELYRWPVICSFLVCLVPVLCHAQVRINEVLAVNRTAFSNNSAFPDYVELYNPTTNNINIGAWHLMRDPTQSRQTFRFPVGTIIPAGGYLIVVCDKQTNAPGLHTGYEL